VSSIIFLILLWPALTALPVKNCTCVVIEKALWPLLDLVITSVFWKGTPMSSKPNLTQELGPVPQTHLLSLILTLHTKKRAATHSSEAKTAGQPAQKSPCVVMGGSPTASGGK